MLGFDCLAVTNIIAVARNGDFVHVQGGKATPRLTRTPLSSATALAILCDLKSA